MGTVFWNRGIPNEANNVIGDFARKGDDVLWVAFTSDGGFSVISRSTFFNRNIPEECHDQMLKLRDAGDPVRCVAFTPGGKGFSLITDKTFFNRNIPQECHDQMLKFRAAGDPVRCVAFTAGGKGFSLVTDKTYFNRNIPQGCHEKMGELNDQGRLLAVAFPSSADPSGASNRWSVLADNGYFNRNIPDEAHQIIGEVYSHQGPVRNVAFAPTGWSVVGVGRQPIYQLPFDYDPDWALWNANWDDPVAGHGKGDPKGHQAFAFDFVHDADKDGVGEAGQNIRCARGGVVTFADDTQTQNTWGLKKGDPGYGAPGSGNLVVIDHGDGTSAGYNHLQHKKVFVKVGDEVSTGDVIALAGNTGHSSTAHLHFDVFPTSGGQTIPIVFTARDHLSWRPRVGDKLLSSNS